nr:GTP cyclohydrolase I FolE [Peribacillus deserti]
MKLQNVIGRNLNQEEIALAENIMSSIQDLIQLAGDDPSRDGLQESPYRFLKAILEYTKGYQEDPSEHLDKTFEVTHDDIVLVKNIPFNSLCEHHFAPFFGMAHIAYIPSDKITGLSKFARLVDGYANRFQVQERLTQEIADAINKVLNPKAIAVILEAEHYCMCGRGVKKAGATTVTSTMRGMFEEDRHARAEVLHLLK